MNCVSVNTVDEQQSVRFLLQGSVGLVINSGPPETGQFVLTETALVYAPDIHPDNLFRTNALEWVDLNDIQSLEFTKAITSAGCQVTFKTTDGQATLTGESTPQLFALIELIRRDGPGAITGAWSAGLYSGLMMRTGCLAINSRRLVFVPQNSVDALVGQGGTIEIPMEQVCRVEVVGKYHKRLAVRTEYGRYVFDVLQPEERLFEIGVHLMNVDAEDDPIASPASHTLHPSDAKEVIGHYRDYIDGPHGRILLSGPAVQLVSGQRAQRGWISLTEHMVIFAPAMRPGLGEIPLTIPITACTLEPTAHSSGEITVKSATACLRALPRGGREFAETFCGALAQRRVALQPRPRSVYVENRRRHERVKLNVSKPVILALSGQNHSDPPRRLRGRTIDLSEGGISVLVSEPIDVDTGLLIDFDFEFFTGSLAGRIANQIRIGEQWRLGVEFTDLTSEHIREIRRTLKWAKQALIH